MEQLSYAEFLDGLPSPTCIVSLGLRPYDGSGVLELNPSLVFPIIEMLLGGTGKSSVNIQRDVTEIEQRLLDGLFRIILQDLREAWKAVTDVDFTIECSGNHGFPFVTGLVGNARWGGAPLAEVLEEAGLLHQATEVVFWGMDSGKVTIRDNTGILPLPDGSTGTVEPDSEGGLDLTITEHFARSMSVREALHPDNLLCYEMNGESLPPEHGFPLRLIAPGWYGVANVKWLTRIDVLDHRFAGRFMARDYVSIREQKHNGETVWTFTTVRHELLKSAPAKVTSRNGRYAIMGAAWGAPISAVEVQVDNGPWMATRLERPAHKGAAMVQTEDEPSTADTTDGHALHRRRRSYAWNFWHFDWGTPASGEHKIRSRAFDIYGNMQPAPEDPFLASKRTFWESNGHITRQVLIP